MADDGLDGGVTSDIQPSVPVIEDTVDEPSLTDNINDDTLREYAQGKGYQNVDDVLKSQRNAEIELRRLQSEIDSFRNQVESEDDGGEIQQQDAGPMPDFNELVNIFGGNESAAVDFIVQQRLQERHIGVHAVDAEFAQGTMRRPGCLRGRARRPPSWPSSCSRSPGRSDR